MACRRTNRNVGLRLFRHLRRHAPAAFGAALVTLALVAPSAADALKTALTATVNDGYARLLFTASEFIDGSARVAGNVLIISFKQPIDVSVDRIAGLMPDYIGAARRDPDGKAVRFALEQPVKVNAMAAGEKFFVDLLPDTWTGVPPGLPQDVVDDLARRARQVDEMERREKQLAQSKKLAPIRVHVATQPTFTRYIFDVPDQTAVSADRAKDRLILNFNSPVTFDLADADAALPEVVQEISSELDSDKALVRFIFSAKVDVRTFRDEKGYVVDVVKPAGEGEQAAPASPPATMPVNGTNEGGAISGVAAAAQPVVPKIEGLPPVAAQSQMAPRPVIAPSAPATVAARPAAPPAAAPPDVVAPSPPPAAKPSAVTDAPAAPVTQNAVPVPPQAESKEETENAKDRQPASIVQAAAPPAMSAPSAPATAAPLAAPVAEASSPAAPAAPLQDAGAGGKDTGKIAVEIAQQGANLKLSFPFHMPVAAAVFRRADMLWIVFDAKDEVDLSALEGEPSRTIRGYYFKHTADADIIRLKLDRPHLSSVATEGPVWTLEIGDSVLQPTHALDVTRNVSGPNRSSISIPFEGVQQVHRIDDPEVGDSLFVVTAFAPARGFINEQDFIEFHALASTQGVVIEPVADDINVELAPDKVVVGRPSGLILSASLQILFKSSGLRPVMFDSQMWGKDREGSYAERQSHLIDAAANAPESKRMAPRIDLARFYLARDMYQEAKGVLDVALADDKPVAAGVSAVVLRAIAEDMMNRPEDALKDLADPAVGDQHDARLWRALAYAREGKWSQARDAFKIVDAAVATLPVELQRVALKDEMRSAIEVGDYDSASSNLNDFETIGVPHDMEPVIAVLMGRLAEGMGRNEDALSAYRTAADLWDRPAAAQGLLRETALRYRLGEIKRDDVIAKLETLTTVWRGDETEIEALKDLAHLYTKDGRYRDAFYVMRSAMAARPDSELTRQIQDEAAVTFDSLFLAGKGDAMPAIDALALFYDFRELTPIGTRGDEMIRRLADRLVSVDLLDQAADLLQYQIDHRLQGAARAQVAPRLAVIYLMNRKADRALATLRATRTADLSNELRNQRLLLEARALSDLGRHDLALEVIANLDGREVTRLRSDILWAARRWDDSAEQIELMYGDRFKDFQPLGDTERQDLLRAAVGYALAEDKLGLGRFREKYAAKMAATPDARDFEIVSVPLGASGTEFAAIAHAAASADTLEGFLRDMKARYPEASPNSPASEPSPTASDAPAGTAPTVSAQPPETQPAQPALPPVPPPRAAGRTAQR